MVQVAILGFGTVGSGVAEVLDTNGDSISHKSIEELRLKYILDTREFPDSPYADKLIHDFSVIENDPEVQIVVECIGGAGIAYDFVRRCLLKNKHVITSNKELVATHGQELLTLAKERNLNFLFEASVGGGIPIIRPLSVCFNANEITEVYGILNGTTNYILTKMIDEGADFDDVLRDAQEKGYAERDPSADVDGLDACRKICILAALSFGKHVYPDQVPTTGITAITQTDVAFAAQAKMRIKLLGRAVRLGDGRVTAYVSPHLIPEKQQIATVDDVFNAIVVKGNAVGDTMFYGRGAGKLPTASAVVADVIDAANHLTRRKRIFWEDGSPDDIADFRQLPMRWFLRTDEPAEKLFVLEGAELLEPVNGQNGVITAAMTLEALESTGLHIIERIPVLD